MPSTTKRLKITDHSRDHAGMTYVYPVVSRRAEGVSIGINLNPNNACNWRCIYCQVPELKRGAAPKIDLAQLETELRRFLLELVNGDFMQQQVPPEARRINDIALSGNGEPTSAKEFEQVITLIKQVKQDFTTLPSDLKLVLITNGSLINRPYVQAGLSQMASMNGEVWFKLDSATREGRLRMNNTRMSIKQVRENLAIATSLCPTWIQTCVMQVDDKPATDKETDAYLKFIDGLISEGVPLKGVLLYGISRPSLQPEATRLSKVTQVWITSLSERINALGLTVKLTP